MTIFLALGFSTMAEAKRLAPQKVNSVVSNGIEYRASRIIGCVDALDVKTKTSLWFRQIYVVKYRQNLEKDVQDIHIKRLEIKDGKLLIINETNQVYKLDLATLEVDGKLIQKRNI